MDLERFAEFVLKNQHLPLREMGKKYQELQDDNSDDPTNMIYQQQMRIIRAAFKVDYDDPRGRVKRLLDFCGTWMRRWRRSEYYAPYSAIIQSSGTGKSRLIAELAKKRFVIYCCLREISSTGYPPRSRIADLLLPTAIVRKPNRKSSETLYLSYLVSAVEIFNQTVSTKNLTKSEWFDYHTLQTDNDFWEKVGSNMREIQVKLAIMTEIERRERMREALDNAESLFDHRFNVQLIFVFDEARSLLPTETRVDCFIPLRHALQYLPEYAESYGRTFTLLLDTTSIVANFIPEASNDPSNRVSRVGLELMPPFYLMDTIDDTWTASNPPATVMEMRDPIRLAFLGRPLFRSYIRALNSKATHQDILTIRNLARSKLVRSTEFSSKLSMIEALSVLSVRLCLDIVPTNHIASEMVGSYLRLCIFISKSRRYLFTISPSEPILVDVAAELMFQPGHLVKLIDRLFDATRCGVVDGGYRGELVARLLLLLAADVASMNKSKSGLLYKSLNWTGLINAQSFLEALLGKKAIGLISTVEDEECSKFLSGTIFFTHFIPMFYSPRRQHLLHAMTRGAAIICKRNNAGVDLIIPVLLASSSSAVFTSSFADDPTSQNTHQYPEDFAFQPDIIDEPCDDLTSKATADSSMKTTRLSSTGIQDKHLRKLAEGSYKLHPSFISFILIQVKNYQDSYDSYIKIARERIQPQVCKLLDKPANFPFMSLYMQLGGKVTYVQELPEIQQQFIKSKDGHLKPKLNPYMLDSIKKYQIGLAIFGVNKEVYSCLASSYITKNDAEVKNLVELIQELLVSWPDPAAMHGNINSNANQAVRSSWVGAYNSKLWNDTSVWTK